MGTRRMPFDNNPDPIQVYGALAKLAQKVAAEVGDDPPHAKHSKTLNSVLVFHDSLCPVHPYPHLVTDFFANMGNPARDTLATLHTELKPKAVNPGCCSDAVAFLISVIHAPTKSDQPE